MLLFTKQNKNDEQRYYEEARQEKRAIDAAAPAASDGLDHLSLQAVRLLPGDIPASRADQANSNFARASENIITKRSDAGSLYLSLLMRIASS